MNIEGLANLVEEGKLKMLTPKDVHNLMKGSKKSKYRKRANDVYRVMVQNSEILIQGEIPEGLIQPVNL